MNEHETELGVQSLMLLMASQIRAVQVLKAPDARLSWQECLAESIAGIRVFIEGRAQIQRLLEEAGLKRESELIFRP